MSLFKFRSCREYIKEVIQGRPKGYQNQLATRCRIHPSYLSRYLSGKVGLTKDHGFSICNEWGLKSGESSYFLLLLDYENAATENLKKYLSQEIEELRESLTSVGTQVSGKQVLATEGSVYYSDWHYSALHILLTVPSFRTEAAMASRLKVPIEVIRQMLSVLEQLRLIQKNGKQWEVTERNIHLKATQAFASQQHRNWRVHTAERISFADPKDVHFSAVHSMSEGDFRQIKALLKEMILNIDRRVRPSKEEDVFFLGVDFFRV